MDNEFVIRQICEGAKRVIGVERIRIRVNPADEEYVRQHRAQVLMNADSVRDLVIESDETIEQGSCVIESDAGNVDTLIATQLERIEAALFGEAEK
jgi:flagellar assembly protein FliH